MQLQENALVQGIKRNANHVLFTSIINVTGESDVKGRVQNQFVYIGPL